MSINSLFEKLPNKSRRRKNFKINLNLYEESDLYSISEGEEYFQNADFNYKDNQYYLDDEFEDEYSSDDTMEDEFIVPSELFNRFEVTTKIKLNRLFVYIGNWHRKNYLVEKDNQFIIKEDIINVLNDFYSIFVDNQNKKMKTVANNMIININTPFINNPIPTEIQPLKLTKNRLNYLFENGYIKKCDHFDYDTKPIIAQLNQDDTYTLDYEYLNSITEFSIYPNVDKNQIFQGFFPHYLYTKLKINDAYLQLSIDSNSYHKTAFKFPDNDQIYEFTSFHEGLKNSENYLQYALNTILLADQYPDESLDGINLDDYRKHIKIYLDEILICSHYEFENHSEHGLVVHNCFYHLKLLRIVLFRLKHFNIKVDVTESFFAVDKVRFVDRDLSQDFILIDRKKIAKILTYSELKTKEDVNDYLDLVYDCRDYSSILFYELQQLMIKLEMLSYSDSFINDDDFLKTFLLIRDSFRIYY